MLGSDADNQLTHALARCSFSAPNLATAARVMLVSMLDLY